MDGVSRQVLARRAQHQVVALAGQFAEHVVNPLRPFEPPVAEQLGVIGGNDHRRARHPVAGPDGQVPAAIGEVAGMALGRFPGRVGIVQVLVLRRPGDAVILDARLGADALGILERLQVRLVEIEADVPVVFAVGVIGRVADVVAPDELGGRRDGVRTPPRR